MRNTPNKPRKNRILMVTAGLIIALVAIFVMHLNHKHTLPPNQEPVQQPEGLLESPKTISAFSITDDSGKPFSNDNLKGHWTFLFFGFSRCGEVCPTTLSQLNEMSTQLKKDLPAQLIPQIVMVTIDPETDTTDVMHKYVKNFNTDFIGATADTNMLNTFSKDLGMTYKKIPEGSNGYMMDHSAELYLFNPDGNWAATFGYPRETDSLVKSYEDIVQPKTKA